MTGVVCPSVCLVLSVRPTKEMKITEKTYGYTEAECGATSYTILVSNTLTTDVRHTLLNMFQSSHHHGILDIVVHVVSDVHATFGGRRSKVKVTRSNLSQVDLNFTGNEETVSGS